MRSRTARLLAVVSFVVASLAAVGPGIAPASGVPGVTKGEVPDHVPGRALVGHKAGQRGEAADAIKAHGGRVASYYEPGNFFIVQTPSRAPDWVRQVRGETGIRYAELDFIVTADTHGDSSTPNDPRWGDLWGLHKIKVEEVWDTTTGSATVVVGVIDTGVEYNHEDIGPAQMWKNPGEIPGNGLDDDGNGWVDDYYGADCRNNDGDPMDDHNHGTHVAGTIGAATNNDKGVAGVNWNVSIMALKFLSASGSGSTSDAVECLDYAISKGAHLTSNSWGGGGYSQVLWDAITRAKNADQIFVAAAGNDGKNTDKSPHYPSSYDQDNVVSVAATDSNDNPASFTNYGVSTVDIGAPGVAIWSTIRNNGYDDYSGTSMATPHVAGTYALLKGAYPTASWQTLLDRLYGSVDPLSSLAGKVRTGGRLNAARALEPDITAPGPTGLTAGSATRTSVAFSWTAPAEDGPAGLAVSSYELSLAPSGSASWASAPAPKPAAPTTAQSATVSGLRPGTTYDFRLVAKDNAANVSSETVTASTGPGTVIFEDDMESGTSKWTTVQSPWAITAERPHSPTRSWSDSPNGSHANSRDVSVASSSFSLATATKPWLTLWLRYNLEPTYDFAYIYISTDGGSSWTQLAKYDGHLDYYKPFEFDLGPYAGASDVRLRVRFTSDMSIVYDGVYFDDVIVSAESAALAVTNVSASPNPFSPNGDGTNDSTTISFDLNKEASWTVSVVSVSDRSWSGTSGPGKVSVVWDGKNSSNAVVAEGSYTVDVSATSGSEIAGGSTSVTVDTTAPTISGDVAATDVTGSSAKITWSTDEASDSVVVYGTASGSYTNTASNSSLVTSHSVSLTNLQSGTTYYYRAKSADAAGNRATSPEYSFTTASVQTAEYPPSSVNIYKGTNVGGTVSDLATSNDVYYQVASKRQGRNHVANWSGSIFPTVTGIVELTVTVEGSATAPVTRKVYLFNFSTQAWDLLSTSTLSSADVAVAWTTTNVAPYISGSREVRVREEATNGGSFTYSEDQMLLTVKY